MSSHDNFKTELSRDLNLFHITMMGIGMMIGAGIFLGVGNAIHHAGPGGVILTFAANGLIAIFTAMSYAELSSAIPKAGGAYNFARVGFGRQTSFLAGWMEWFASSIAGSAYAVTFALYVWRYIIALDLFTMSDTTLFIAEKSTAAVIALVFIYINYRGASETGKIGAIFSLGQTIFLLVIGIVGIFIVLKDPSRLQNFDPFLPKGWSRLFVTMGFTYVAFEGYEVIAQAGDETINPKQNLPKAMIYSVFVVTITYVLVSFATVVSVKAGQGGVTAPVWEWIGSHGAKGFGESIAQIMPFANFLLTIAVIFASTSALNATIFSATRASYALGRDKMLPESIGKVSQKSKTPYIALILTGGIIIFVAVFLNTMDVASTASIMFLFLFFLVNVSVIKIRRNMGDELEYGFMMPFFPILPILAIIFQVLLVANLHEVSKTALIIGPAWVLVGFIIYHFYSKNRASASDDEIFVLEKEEEITPKKGYNIMVAVSNPMNALGLIKNTYKICGEKDANIDLLHMVPVPDHVPLSDADRYMMEGKEAITEMMMYLTPHFNVNSTIKYCRNVARGIVSSVREKRVNLLIMGWHGKSEQKEFQLGSTIDPIVERTPSNVIIFKNASGQKYKRILVPLSGGPNCNFALEAAVILSETNAEIVAFHVDNGKYNYDIQKDVNEIINSMDIGERSIETHIVKCQSVFQKIMEKSAEFDLIVIGNTGKSIWQNFWQASLPEKIAEECEKPIAMVKANKGLRSWIKQYV
jgi:APA family basic amino acid/polyamine antiporter